MNNVKSLIVKSLIVILLMSMTSIAQAVPRKDYRIGLIGVTLNLRKPYIMKYTWKGALTDSSIRYYSSLTQCREDMPGQLRYGVQELGFGDHIRAICVKTNMEKFRDWNNNVLKKK